ncbi:hypothetical protein F5Y19DRAFT_455837 [Xylariaceae sp. FL1651]|nr:hypothetical protein F5Y19DRAFT_455837 [Xylariaceae sp. FL1651]
MFRWYRKAKVCYAYLSDVTSKTDMASSRWFTRGWTLQELIAPRNVQFYSSDWGLLGSKDILCDTLHSITGVEKIVLSSGIFAQVCVARRMAWAAKRVTTRIEDQAYSLMGIFDVNMPLIYGEGKKAFLRLQEQILAVSDDQSLFAWGAPRQLQDMHILATSGSDSPQMHSLFADSPADFLTDHEILQVRNRQDSPPPVLYGNGVRVQYPVCAKTLYDFIMIACTIRGRSTAHLAIPTRRWERSFHARCGPWVLVFADDWPKFQAKALVVKEPVVMSDTRAWPTGFRLLRVPNDLPGKREDHFNLIEVYCAPHALYSPASHSISLQAERQARIHAALIFQSNGHLTKTKPKSNMFSLHYFAIVLGMGGLPFTAFIPLLRESRADADFHELFRADPQLIRNCMLKSQLVATILKDDLSKLPPGETYIVKVLGTWMERKYATFVQWDINIGVSFRIAPTNLVDDGTFVFLDMRKVKRGVVTSTSRLSDISYVASVEDFALAEPDIGFDPDWVEVENLEWFKEQMVEECN